MIFIPGQEFNENFKISEKTYNDFINLFKDKNPLHTDEDYAIARGFKSKVMHGNILNGLVSYFIGECLPVKDVIIHSQEIQFKYPVYLNDELQLSATVSEVYESVNAVIFKIKFINAENKVVAKGKIQIGLLS